MRTPSFTRDSIRSPRRAIALIELLVCLVIVGLAMNVAARLLHSTMKNVRATAAATDQVSAQRQWIDHLRQDAWSARTYEVQGNRLTLSSREQVIWTLNPGRLVRESTATKSEWHVDDDDWSWTSDNARMPVLQAEDTRITLAMPMGTQAGAR